LTVTFRVPDGRYYLQILILLIPVAVLPVMWALRNLFVRKGAVASVGVLVLFAASCLGFPSRTGYNSLKTDRFQAWDALHFRTRPQSEWFLAQKQFTETWRKQPGIILSDIDAVYLNALVPKPFIGAPMDAKHKRKWSPVWHYGEAQALALAKRGLEQSLPVYALFVSRKDMNEKAQRLPRVEGYEWRAIPSGKQFSALRLTPMAAPATTPSLLRLR
jgi:hypothetical protein